MNRLKELRKEKGLSQQALADEIGVSKLTILRWEKGERELKSDKAQQLAEYFGVSVGYLLGYMANVPEITFEHNQIILPISSKVHLSIVSINREVEIAVMNDGFDFLTSEFFPHSGGDVVRVYSAEHLKDLLVTLFEKVND